MGINLLRDKQLNKLTKKQLIDMINKATDYQEDYIKESKANGTYDFNTSCYKFICVMEGEAIEHGSRILEEKEAAMAAKEKERIDKLVKENNL